MKPVSLLKYREIFIYGEIDTELAFSVNTHIHWLDYQNPEPPIYIYINSPGGEIDDGFAIVDCIRNCKSTVYTIAQGEACSMGAMVLLAGDYRYASSHSTIMFHEASIYVEAPKREYQSMSIHLDKQELIYIKSLSKRLKIPVDKLQDIFGSVEYMTAEQAKNLKLIDGIWDYKTKAINEFGV